MFGSHVVFTSSDMKLVGGKINIVCPHDVIYGESKDTWAPGRYVFTDPNNKDIRVIFRNPFASDDMQRVEIPVGGTLVIDDNTPEAVITQAKELGLHVAVLDLKYI